ncbi:MAG TPA: serine hydrolase domain-containing protein [Acidimicrobiales bacterium]|nr:serine hydrolase domain-containing protein [Acidimicrobiales bacterium]
MIPERLVDAAARWCEKRGLPGAQVAVARDGEVELFEAVGDATAASRFLIWSCTKAIVASVIWQLVGEGRVAYDEKVATYLPEFATNGKDVVTLDQVLLHTAGFPSAPLGPARWATSASRREAFARWRLNWEPGTQYEYHQLAGAWVLAEVIEAVEGRDYRAVIHERVTVPLGLTSFRLGVDEADQGDVEKVVVVGDAATDDEYIAAGWDPLPPPTVSPHGALLMNTPAALALGIPGGGGVANAADVARFYQGVLRHDPKLWDAAVLADATSVVRNTFPDTGRWGESASRGRGVVIRGDDEPYASLRHHFGPATSPRTFGHDGAGGQIAWADPDTGTSFCFLTNGYDANRVEELLRNQELSRLAAETARGG